MKTPQSIKGWLPAITILGALLAACGGGGIGSGGTGSSPNGVAVGTVDGFGSIFIGGVRCDDLRAKISYNSVAGGPEGTNPEVKLGQRLEVDFDPASQTCKLLLARITPELIGVVSSTAPLTVAGARVLINSDPSIAPPTVIEGFDSAASIAIGDRVEVHGKPVTVASGVAIQATRIERKPSSETWVRVAGVVKNLNAAQFNLGGLTVAYDSTTTTIERNGALANDQSVAMWSTGAVSPTGAVTARFIRVLKRDFADQQQLRVEGPVSGCAATGPCTNPTIDGIAVDLAGAQFSFGSLLDVANGVAMHVRGQFDSVNNRLVASNAAVRKRDAAAGNITLIGMVADFVSTADFRVRGMPVTTDANTTVAAGCTIAAGQVVGIRGQISEAVVKAKQVDCLTLADGTTLDIFGSVLNLDPSAKTFNLSEGPFKTYTLAWDDNTQFGAGASASGLANGQRVGLRAVLTEGQLLIKRILIDDPAPASPTGALVFGNFGIVYDKTTASLAVNKIHMDIVAGTTTLVGNVESGSAVRTWFYRDTANNRWVALRVKQVVW